MKFKTVFVTAAAVFIIISIIPTQDAAALPPSSPVFFHPISPQLSFSPGTPLPTPAPIINTIHPSSVSSSDSFVCGPLESFRVGTADHYVSLGAALIHTFANICPQSSALFVSDEVRDADAVFQLCSSTVDVSFIGRLLNTTEANSTDDIHYLCQVGAASPANTTLLQIPIAVWMR